MSDLEDLHDDENEEIARVAYSYWETRGREDGHDMEDWLLAEQEVIRSRAVRSVSEVPARRSTAA